MLTADGPKSDPATWTLARHAAATLANTFLSSGWPSSSPTVRSISASDRAALEQYLSTGVTPLYVTLRVTFEEALRRAQGDPTRGVSRDPVFLGEYFAAATAAQEKIPETDVVIDTEAVSATGRRRHDRAHRAAGRMTEALSRARGAPPRSCRRGCGPGNSGTAGRA